MGGEKDRGGKSAWLAAGVRRCLVTGKVAVKMSRDLSGGQRREGTAESGKKEKVTASKSNGRHGWISTEKS